MATKTYRTYEDIHIDMTDITNGSAKKYVVGDEERYIWTGTGALDVLLATIDNNLKIQFDSGRLSGKDYAAAYVQLYTEALRQAPALVQANMELQLKAKTVEIENKIKAEQEKSGKAINKLQQEYLRAQTKVLERQAQGFSDNLKVKLLQTQLDAFSAAFSSGLLNIDENSSAFPKALKASALSEVYDELLQSSRVNWDSTPTKYSVERRINKGQDESGIDL